MPKLEKNKFNLLKQKQKSEIQLRQKEQLAKERQEKFIMEQQKKEWEYNKEKEQEAKEKAEKRKQLNEKLLDMCLDIAQESYKSNWKTNCKSVAKRKSTGYKSCLQRLSENDCKSLWGEIDSSSNCSLPIELTSSLNEDLKNQKNDCFKKYPQK